MSRLAALTASIGLILGACSNGDSDTGNQPGLTDSQQAAIAGLAATVHDVESVRAVKQLQRAYGQFLGAGRADLAAELFADDAVYIEGDIELRGRDDIQSYLQTMALGADNAPGDAPANATTGLPYGRLFEPLILSPVINLDDSGSRALGRWRLVELNGQHQNNAGFAGGIFENEYIVNDGVWQIATLHYYPIYAGPYAEGWRILEEETEGEVEPIPFHYDADLAGIPIPVRDAGGAGVSDNTVASAEDLRALESRAQRLLDEQDVLNLQNTYGYYVDRMLWDDVADLFTADGTMEIGHSGVYQGRDSIRRALDQFGPSPLPATTINDHLQLQPVVTIAADGLSANVRGTELQMLGEFEQSASWGLAVFENRFVKQDGGWQIAGLHIYSRMLADYDIGWATDAQAAPVAAAGYPADSEASVDYSVYPEFYAPAFGFDAASVGAIGNARANTPAGGADAGTAPGIDARIAELGRKLQVLQAYDGAENVSNAYGYYIDEFLWDGMADVFSVGGYKELSYIGTYIGRERVRDSVVSRYGRGGRRANSMTFHQKVQPVVTVAEDGLSASIRTRLFQLNSSTFNAGSYISGIYENLIVFEDGIWRVDGMDLDYQWTADYDPGWHRVEPGASQRFAPAPGSLQGDQAPDTPLRGVTFAPYPDGQLDMAFHYVNPVSGRRPPVLLENNDSAGRRAAAQ